MWGGGGGGKKKGKRRGLDWPGLVFEGMGAKHKQIFFHEKSKVTYNIKEISIKEKIQNNHFSIFLLIH